MNTVVLDTNAYQKLLMNDKEVYHHISHADITYLSPIMLGELYYGFYGGNKFESNIKRLKSFLSKSSVSVLQISEETSLLYGQIKNSLRKSGTPIPTNDIWIAAGAMETGSK